MAETTRIAVLVIAADRRDHLRRLLDGVADQVRPPDDVIVVDLRPGADAPRRASPARHVALHGARADGPLHLAAGRNLAAASTSCDRLVFLDVDCLPAPDLVARYVEALDTHPDAIAGGPVRYLRPDWLERCDHRRPTVEQLDGGSDHPPARPRVAPGSVQRGDDHTLFWSLSFGVTRTTWDRVGGFDDSYVGYGAEDTDFALRARAAGVGLAWFGGGTAYHQWHPPSRDDPDKLDELIANAHRFRRRWGSWPMSGWLETLRRDGVVRFDDTGDLLERTG